MKSRPGHRGRGLGDLGIGRKIDVSLRKTISDGWKKRTGNENARWSCRYSLQGDCGPERAPSLGAPAPPAPAPSPTSTSQSVRTWPGFHMKGRRRLGSAERLLAVGQACTPLARAGFGRICIAGADACPFLLKEVLIWDKLPGIRSRRGRE